LNTPHNPTGKVFTREELEEITSILKDFPDCMVLADEVYDFLTYDGLEHTRFATIGDNWNRTVTVYSGGKKFNATGWKVGWAIGHQKLVRLGGILNNTSFYCQNTPGQVAMAQALRHAEQHELESDGSSTFLNTAKANFTEVRDYLTQELMDMPLPWEPLSVESGYFLMADITKCRDLIGKKFLESHDYEDDKNGTPAPHHPLYMPGTK